jgi:hypothetical protein
LLEKRIKELWEKIEGNALFWVISVAGVSSATFLRGLTWGQRVVFGILIVCLVIETIWLVKRWRSHESLATAVDPNLLEPFTTTTRIAGPAPLLSRRAGDASRRDPADSCFARVMDERLLRRLDLPVERNAASPTLEN